MNDMENNYCDLFTLLSRFKETFERSFSGAIWVKAEISSLNYKSNGHCYLDLCQTEDGKQIAKTKAAIWASRYSFINKKFTDVTGSPLTSGIAILAKITVSYHVLYGITLSIEDIDPNFTLGKNELYKRQTIERLEKEGLMDLQKELLLPLLPYSLAIISADGAAGLGDFCNHIQNNQYGYAFKLTLFQATMQGETAPKSIVDAFHTIAADCQLFDAILLLRGGGSELDLACFDNYDIAKAIALSPLPVITAIGHDKDFHVADMIANKYVKTPTALADLFLDLYIAQDSLLSSYEARLAKAFANRLASMTSALDSRESRIFNRASTRINQAVYRIDSFELRIANLVNSRLMNQEHLLERLSDRIAYSSKKMLDSAESSINKTEQRIKSKAESAIAAALSKLMMVETRIKMTDPRNILKKGFVLALDGAGVKMNSASKTKIGDKVQMMFADGTVKCGVIGVDKKNNVPDELEAQLNEIFKKTI